MTILLFVALILFVLAIIVVRTILGLLLLLLLAGLCGAVAQSLLEYKRGGIGTTLLIGLVGAAVGAIIARVFGLPLLLVISRLPIIWSLAGSIVLVVALKLVAPEQPKDAIPGLGRSQLPPDV
jgi:uncharacterized membrane protein YeaQ/YmgE (transglycosylase-associated protein family)